MTLQKTSDFIRSIVENKECDSEDLFLIKAKIEEFEKTKNDKCPYPEECPMENAEQDAVCGRCEDENPNKGEASATNEKEDMSECPFPAICPNEQSFNYCPECGLQND
jgi:hypothetical protein